MMKQRKGGERRKHFIVAAVVSLCFVCLLNFLSEESSLSSYLNPKNSSLSLQLDYDSDSDSNSNSNKQTKTTSSREIDDVDVVVKAKIITPTNGDNDEDDDDDDDGDESSSEQLEPNKTKTSEEEETETSSLLYPFTIQDETGHPIHLLKNPLSIDENDENDKGGGGGGDLNKYKSLELKLKIPTPIFVLNLAKSGTTTIHQYFNCGLGTLDGKLLPSAHHRYPAKVKVTHKIEKEIKTKTPRAHSKINIKFLVQVGPLMSLNVKLGLPLLTNTLKLAKLAATQTASSSTSTETETVAMNFTDTTIRNIMHDHYNTGTMLKRMRKKEIYDMNFIEFFNMHNDETETDRSLEEYSVLSNFEHFDREGMFLPTDALENIATFYPNATVLFVNRDPAKWFQSAVKWNDLLPRMRTYKGSNLTNGFFERPENYVSASSEELAAIARKGKKRKKIKLTEKDKDEATWTRFVHNYATYIRSFAKTHPSLTYIEVPLDDNTGMALEERTGIPNECWGHANTNEKHVL